MIKCRRYIVLSVVLLISGIIQGQDGNQPVLDVVTVDTTVSITNQCPVTIYWSANPNNTELTFEIQIKTPGRPPDIISLPYHSRQWFDATAKANQRVESYQITSKIPGQDQTIWSELHKTILLQVLKEGYDTCNQAIPIQWNNYVGEPIINYQLYVKKNNEPYQALNPVSGDTIFTHSQLEPGARYHYYVEATLANGKKSLSNYVEFSTYQPIAVKAEELIIDTIINNDGLITLKSKVDAIADLHGYQWNRIFGGKTEKIKTETNLEAGRIELTNEPFQKNAGFQVSAIDLCNNEPAFSNKVYPIELTAVQNDEMVEVDWNQSFETLDKETYQLKVETNNLGIKSYSFDNTHQILSLNELGDESSQQFCFQVISTAGQKMSTSNRVCIIRKPDIEIPNGFTPNSDGHHDTFGPIIHNANIRSYKFIVFDQFGGRVFESNNSQQRWDGTCKGLPVIEGGYVYYLKFTTQYNQTYELKGAVNVIFP